MKLLKFAAWKKERLGMGMIVSTLAVISFILLLFFKYQQQNLTDQIQRQGTSLTRLLAEVPFEQLATSGKQSALDILFYSHSRDDLAYAVLVSAQGQPIQQVVSPGVLVPETQLPEQPSQWLGQRNIESPRSGDIIEFYAPILAGPHLKGYIRLGYRQPRLIPAFSQWSFAASLALPIFLLTPLFYFLMRREIKPMIAAQQALNRQLESGSLQQLEISAGGEVGEFIKNLNSYVEFSRGRIKQMESEQSNLVTSSKVLEYKFSKVTSMLQALPDGIIVLDKCGSVIFANDKLKILLNADPKEVMSEETESWCKIRSAMSFIRNCQRYPGLSFGPETIELKDNHTLKAIDMSAQPLFGDDQKSTSFGTVIVIRDATNEAMAKSGRESFVAHIAHELKTPLNAMSMYSQALMDAEHRDEAFVTEAINVIHDETERMIGLINNTLNITRIESGSLGIDRRRVKITDLVKDAMDNITRESKDNNVHFDLKMPKDTGPVSIDKNMLRIAINNLLTNAVKYNQPGGTVTLELTETGDSIFIHVRDTGIGISEEDLSKVFDKFYRSEDDHVRERTGHGLGLALAREIVQLHHGQLTVSSELGKGSEFVIEIPKETERLKQVV